MLFSGADRQKITLKALILCTPLKLTNCFHFDTFHFRKATLERQINGGLNNSVGWK